MPSKANFKQLPLVHSMHLIFKMQSFPKLICSTFLISSCISVACAQEQLTDTSNNKTLAQSLDPTKPEEKAADTSVALSGSVNQLVSSQPQQDSVLALKQQEQSVNQINELKPIQLDDNLENLPVIPVDQAMTNEIFRVAEDAKNEAQIYRDSLSKSPELIVNDISQPELLEITKAPVDINQLIQEIQTDSKIVVEANAAGRTLPEFQNQNEQQTEKVGFFRKIWNRFHPENLLSAEKIPRISAEVTGAPPVLATNIKAKLSSFTQESFEDFNVALPQLSSASGWLL